MDWNTLYTWASYERYPDVPLTETFTFDGESVITYVKSEVVTPGATALVEPSEIIKVSVLMCNRAIDLLDS